MFSFSKAGIPSHGADPARCLHSLWMRATNHGGVDHSKSYCQMGKKSGYDQVNKF